MNTRRALFDFNREKVELAFAESQHLTRPVVLVIDTSTANERKFAVALVGEEKVSTAERLTKPGLSPTLIQAIDEAMAREILPELSTKAAEFLEQTTTLPAGQYRVAVFADGGCSLTVQSLP